MKTMDKQRILEKARIYFPSGVESELVLRVENISQTDIRAKEAG